MWRKLLAVAAASALAAGCGTEQAHVVPAVLKAPTKVARCILKFPDMRAGGAARARLQRDIEQYVSHRPGRVAYSVLELDTGVGFGRAEHQHDMITASGVKVDILTALMLDRNGLKEEERDLAERMITESDNSAADALWGRVGGGGAMTGFYQRMGLRETVPGPSVYWGGTNTSPADRIRLLKLLVRGGKGLTDDDRALVLGLMGRVVKDQSWGVSAAARPGDQVALKNGWTPRPFIHNTWAVTSYGRVLGPGRDLLLSVQTDQQPGEGSGIETIEGVARMIGSRLDELSPVTLRSCPTNAIG
ncbi:MAG: serine hydrolase [Nonomuraea sp.]|nr:serine hydrolase [Nonomuraea sp.]NUP63812.1 serine hydrolase [Nonomuraea sp.]NUR88176.1 serine hydrolase [Nonomuraea sp.]NUT40429.1 serine hydrolase [Thermoactinospora sp.]